MSIRYQQQNYHLKSKAFQRLAGRLKQNKCLGAITNLVEPRQQFQALVKVKTIADAHGIRGTDKNYSHSIPGKYVVKQVTLNFVSSTFCKHNFCKRIHVQICILDLTRKKLIIAKYYQLGKDK